MNRRTTPLEPAMLLATHVAAICDAIAATGCTVVALTVTAQRGDYGSIIVIVAASAQPTVQGVHLLADVGPGGVHAWRWMTARGWSVPSVDTAAEALARSAGVV